jgi:asparagine synthase (glutamine-hydrolysing)
MCGIAGIIDFAGDGDRDAAARGRLADALRHRGPDDCGHHHHQGVSLVQTRLSIIDLDTGHQPIVSADGDLVLVANGEIYNHVELRATLERAGHRFTTHSDSECILHAYREYGTELFDALNGMFAFILHDLRRARVLFARDRLGIKPLFVAHRGNRVLLASEIKALLALLPGTPELEPSVLARVLQSNFASGNDTVFQGIERVLPGQAFVVARDAPTRCWSYWQPRPETPRIRSEQEAMEAFEPLAGEVVAQHLRADVPVGLFLSSGADSGSLLALMHEQGYAPVDCFTAGFPGTAARNEIDDAAAIARRFGARHHPLRLQRDGVLGALPLAMWSADELMMDYASLPTLLLAGAASRELKVVFSGEGGDEVFAGYGRYRQPLPTRLLAALRGRALGGFRARGSFAGGWTRRVLAPELAAVAWHAPVRESYRTAPGRGSHLTRLQQVDLCGWLPDDLLVKADRMLMAFGVEGRVPYLDHRVVQFGLSLSDGLKVRGRTGKWFLRRWMARRLPAQQVFRRKSGFTVPLADWMDGDFLSRLSQLLPRQTLIQRYFRAEGVQALLQRQRLRGDVTRAVWALLCLAVWHRALSETGAQRPGLNVDPLDFLE